jgi:hypothetical protein
MLEELSPGALASDHRRAPDHRAEAACRAASDPALTAAVAEAAAAIARLDEALANHPLRPAFLYRARLEAVRRQAAVDGSLIDPWHLAALIEGLRLRMDHALRIIDRGAIFEAARHALALHQWITAPDFDEEGEVLRAEAHLAEYGGRGETPLLTAAFAMHGWLEAGGARPPIRAALVRHWTRHRLLRVPVPLTGAAALRAETPWEPQAWVPLFLRALAQEAEDGRQLLADLERAWFAARAAVAGRRRDSHAAAAVDFLAATPLVSATSLAAGLGIAVKNAIALLDGLVAAGLAVEVTHRAKRRLFGLAGMAPLRDGVAAPRRPEPGRGRGRPPIVPVEEERVGPPPPLPPLTPIERREFEYGDLEHWVAHLGQVLRQTRRSLDSLARGQVAPAAPVDQGATTSPDSGTADTLPGWLPTDERTEHDV